MQLAYADSGKNIGNAKFPTEKKVLLVNRSQIFGFRFSDFGLLTKLFFCWEFSVSDVFS